MKTEIYHMWDKDDVSLTFVTSAINLLAAFKDDVQDEAGVKAFHRIVTDRRFTAQDIKTLKHYLATLADRAERKYKQPSLAAAPWRDAITDAIKSAGEACFKLDAIFEAALEANPL